MRFTYQSVLDHWRSMNLNLTNYCPSGCEINNYPVYIRATTSLWVSPKNVLQIVRSTILLYVKAMTSLLVSYFIFSFVFIPWVNYCILSFLYSILHFWILNQTNNLIPCHISKRAVSLIKTIYIHTNLKSKIKIKVSISKI